MAKWDIQWTPGGTILADSFNVYSRVKGDPDWTSVASTTATSWRMEIADSAAVTEVGVAPVVSGLEAPEEDWTVTEIRPNDTSDLTAPGAVANFGGAQAGADVAFRWDALDVDDLLEYEIRQGSSWSNGVRVHTAPATAKSARFLWRYSGATTYYIKGKTNAGLWSSSASSVALTITADEYMPVQTTNDEHGGGFSGTKSGTEVSGGNLQPKALPAAYSSWTDTYSTYTHPWWWPYIPDGTYTTPTTDVGSVVEDKIEIDMDFSLGNASPNYDEWRGQLHPEFDDTADTETALDIDAVSVYDRIDSDENLIDAHDILIEIDTAQDGVPTWDGWRVWVPGAIYTFRQVRLRFTFNMLWPFLFPQITTLAWYLARQNRKDEKTVTISATGGTAVTWDTTFTAAPKVSVSSVGSTALFATVESITTSGCDVRLWNSSGTEQSSGTVHVHALGV